MERNKILIVDDEPAVLRALKNVLKSPDYSIFAAENGEAALEVVRSDRIDLVLSDEQMPSLSGIELIDIINKEFPDILCLLITGHSNLEVAIEAINQGGVYKYINKPWDDEELRITIRRALEHRSAVREREEHRATIERQHAELQKLTNRLERLVEERTADLKNALDRNLSLTEDLQIKVRELEARDQLLEHMLKVHTPDESLKKIAAIIGRLFEVEQVLICLQGSWSENLCTYYVWDGIDKKGRRGDEDPAESKDLAIPDRDKLKRALQEKREVIDSKPGDADGKTPYAYLPLQLTGKPMGGLLISNPHGLKAIPDTNVGSIKRLLPYIAMAINDIGMLERIPDVSEFDETAVTL